MVLWTGYIGIFENKGDWTPDPDTIDLADFGAFGGEWIDLNVKNYGGATAHDLKKKGIANRNTGFFGVNVVDKAYSFNSWVKDSDTLIAEEVLSLIEDFIDAHAAIGDARTYLVIRKKIGAVWHYKKTKDNSGNTLKYARGRAGSIKFKKQKYSTITFSLAFEEGWL